MPGNDPYQNPPNTPPIGKYKWVPPGPAIGSEVPGNGYFALTLERGTFRNDLPNINDIPGSVTTSVVGNIISDFGSNDWPILNAFRQSSIPDSPLGSIPGQPFIVRGNPCSWKVNIIEPVNKI